MTRRAWTGPRVTMWRVGAAALSAGLLLAPGLSSTAQAARPTPPSSLKVLSSGVARYLTWSESTPGTGFVVQQSPTSNFSSSVINYTMRGPGRTLSPYRAVQGRKYYFRVRAVSSGSYSGWSSKVSYTVPNALSAIRVVTYNSMSASADPSHNGGTAAPWSQRRPKQLSLLSNSGAAVIAIQEGAACIIKYTDGTSCYRQIDSLADGLSPKYRLDDTAVTTQRSQRYLGNYLLYEPSVVATVGGGGNWMIGASSNQGQTARYQIFRVIATGAKFLFVNTHLTTGTSYTGDKIRGTETQEMLNDARNYAANQGVSSIIYVGDFNTYVGEWHVTDISGNKMRAAHVPDGVEVAQSKVRAQYDSPNVLYRCPHKNHGSIDHIYASGGVGVVGWGELLQLSSGCFVGAIPSDHNPIYETVQIPY
jgi:hypothetical protein